MNDLIEALRIFAKYSDSEYPTTCDCEELFIMDIDKDDVSAEDIKRLDELSFGWRNESNCFTSYRFGSA